MPTYVVLSNWTDQGIRNVRSTVERVDGVTRLAEKYGASVAQIYWTVGPYDFVSIVEAPDDEAATAFALEISSGGNVRTTTLRAYDRDAMSGIIERMGPSAGT
ncbi:MAG: GYD domain-containing protein [Actinomycetota bacterium]|nr:GYD domain-containing protein [Actinomycetota bacterium]